MKLVVMIPAYNEEKSIASVIQEIPRDIPGIDKVDVLVVDDGSTDNTAEVARKAGADYILSQKTNRGLAFTFKIGLETALKLGADIVVNTDADLQYNQQEIPKLIKPILEHKADIVLGNRQVWKLDHMVFGKKWGNVIGSFFVRRLVGYPIYDSQTGFRAFSREAALRINVLSDYTYTQETIIQAINKRLVVSEVPCTFRAREGHSKLISNIPSYIRRAGITIVRTYTMYKPLKVFFIMGTLLFLGGVGIGVRFLYFYFSGQSGGHIQSLILAAVLMILGFQTVSLGVIADLIDANRKLTEELLYRLKKKELEESSDRSAGKQARKE
ncbi:MAG: glycosyltransferase family 2 protein [Actinomycetota bacterium]|nr:glycosyltransferase family 2 protein [Actinomycetota bacterium]